MNITAQALVFAVASVASVATAAAIATGLGEFSAQPNTEHNSEIVQLERVVVVGKRVQVNNAPLEIVQLPRVVVTGRRSTEVEVQVASSL